MSTLQFSFGVMADCQYADADSIDVNVRDTDLYIHNHYRQSPGKMREAIQTFNQYDLSFIVHLGDFIDRGLADAQPLLPITNAAKAPVWQVLGNHDFLNNEGRTADILACYGMPDRYYAKVVQDYRFIVLDTNDLGIIEYPEGTQQWQEGNELLKRLQNAHALNAYPWNGGIGPTQLQWLQEQLAEASAHQQKAVLFSHHPVFPPNVHDALNKEVILDAIDSSPAVVLYMNGHNHLGNYGVRNDIPYLTVNGMLEGDDNAFGIVQVYDDHIDCKGFGRLGDYSWDLAQA